MFEVTHKFSRCAVAEPRFLQSRIVENHFPTDVIFSESFTQNYEQREEIARYDITSNAPFDLESVIKRADYSQNTWTVTY